MMLFAAIIHSVQLGFDNVPALHGETPVPQLVVTLHLRADAQAAQELRKLAGDGQVVHVVFSALAVKRLEEVPLPLGGG